ncbi:hypothetical protein HK097_004424 [Rhizophlyctis rosea]|uniref:Mediator of RNA polymerase II transcription subunit 17 n=1 Tax=Rhizophlyctis rosea TaxID=64517 RepID=A0AAD5X2S6_9FUNG|nr:hypothetical protein HK097_004424 [Rhizophlyctis rosea]
MSHSAPFLVYNAGDEPNLEDIDAFGNEIYSSQPTPAEQFSQNASRLDLLKLLADTINSEPTPSKEDAPIAEVETPQVHPWYALQDGIHYAKHEIEQTLNLIKQLYNRTAKPEDACFTTAYAPHRPDPTPAKQIETILCAITSKSDHLQSVSEYLKASAQKLTATGTREERFYKDFALKLRQYNWILQQDGKTGQLFVDYGFRNSGSGYQASTVAHVIRDILPIGENEEVDVEKEVELNFRPPRGAKRVRISSAKGLSMEGGGVEVGSDRWEVPDEDTMETHRQLKEARATAYERELFDEIMKELSTKQALTTNARILPQSISLPTSHESSVSINLVRKRKREIEDATPEGGLIVGGDEEALLEVLAHRGLRNLHKFNRGGVEKRKGLDDGTRERPTIASDLIRRKQRMELVERVDIILKALVGSIRGCLDVTVRRKRGGGRESDWKEVDAVWVMVLFGRWEIRTELKPTAQLKLSSSFGKKKSSVVEVTELRNEILKEVMNVCLGVVAEEANMLGLGGSKLKWVVKDSGLVGSVARGSTVLKCPVVVGENEKITIKVPGRKLRVDILVVDSDGGAGSFVEQVQKALFRISDA